MNLEKDLDKCYNYMFDAQMLISKAQEIFERYDIPFVASCPGDALCALDDAIGALEEFRDLHT